jgi:hypothetical protein
MRDFHATEHHNTAVGIRFAPKAARLLAHYVKFGYVIELDKGSYEKHYIANNRPKKPQLDMRYSLCFRFLLAFLGTRLRRLLGREDITLNFVFEEGAAGSPDSHRVIQLIRKQPETRDIAEMLAPAPLSFGEKKKFPGLQASDALSFGSLKLMPDHPEMVDIPQDAPLAFAQQSVQVKPVIYHCRLDETLLAPHKTDIEMMVEFRKCAAAEIFDARNARNS